MTNPMLSILAALGGGAQGAASGLKTIDEMQSSQAREDLQRQVAMANISGARDQREIERQRAANEQIHYQDMLEQQRQQTMLATRQLDRMIASETNAAARQKLEDDRKRLEDFSSNLDKIGVGALDPQMAYNKFGGHMDQPAMTALGGMINQAGKTIGNMPQEFISGSEPYGGLVYKGHPFNPAQGGASGVLLDARRQAAFSRMLTQSMGNIQNAYRNAYNSYASSPAIAKLIASVDGAEAKKGHDAADAAARQQVLQTATGALNTIRQAFPDDAAGLTVDALIGTVDLSQGQGGGVSSGPPAFGSGATPGAPSPSAPSLKFDPNDPLGTGKPMRGAPAGPPGAAPIAPIPPKKPNDPLGFGRP